MEKNIKDYLHLYLGQRVEVMPAQSKSYSGQLQQIDINGYCILADESITRHAYFQYCKLILRPLNSMTEEEAKDLAHIYTGLKITYVRITDGQVIFNYLEGDQVHENVLDVEIVNPDSFRYLLSKGFDLFGLIDAGLAIEISSNQK